MANFTSKAEATVTLNGQQAEAVLDTLKDKTKELRRQIIEVKKTDPSSPKLKDMEKELKRLETSTASIKKTTFDYSHVLKNLNGSTLKELQKTKQTLVNQLKNMVQGTKEYIAAAGNLRKVNAQINEINDSMKAEESLLSKTGSAFGKYFGMIATFASGLTGVTFALKSFRDEAAKMSDVYADVMKTTGMTADEVKQLNEAFKKMDTRTSREELNRLAYEAGKLGIAKDQILGFVQASDIINVALGDVLGDDATLVIGKITDVFKEVQADLRQLDLKGQMVAIGSAINELGKTSTANEQYLVEFAGRLGGVAAQAGISIQNLLGFGSALDQNMQQVEMSATAISKFIMNIMGDPAKYAKIAGIEVKEFSRLLSEDANAAILKVIKSLGDKGGFQQLVPIFKEMGMDGARAVGVLSSMANNIDKITEAQAISNKAFAEGTSMLGEYNIKNNTLAAELEKNRKKVADLREEIGQRLQGTMLTTSKLFFEFVKILTSIPKEIYIAIAAIILLTTRLSIASGAIKAWGLIARTTAKTAKTATLGWAATMNLLTGNTAKAQKAWKELTTVMKGNYIVAIIAAVTALSVALYKFFTSTDRATKAYKEFTAEFGKEKRQMNAIFEALKKTNEGTEERRNLINKINSEYGEYLGYQLSEKANLDEIKKAQDKVITSMRTAFAERKKAEAKGNIDEEYADMYDSLIEYKEQAEEYFKLSDFESYNYIEKIKSKMEELVETGKKFNKNIVHSISESAGIGKNTAAYLDTNAAKKYYDEYLKYYKEIKSIDKKFEVILGKEYDTSDYMVEGATVTGKNKKKNVTGETDEEREKRFKSQLSRMEQAQREERTMQARAYLTGKTDRQEYNAALEAIDFAYLLKRKMLYEQFAKDTGEIDANIVEAQIKRMEKIDAQIAKASEKWNEFAKKSKAQSEQMAKEAGDAEKDIEDEQYADFLAKSEKATAIRNDLRKGKINEQMQEELAEIDELYSAHLLTQEEYEAKRMEIRINAFKAYMEQVNQLLQSGSQMAGAFQDAEVAKVEAASQRKIKAINEQLKAGLISEEEYNSEKEKIDTEAAQQKLDVEKKFADVNFAIRVAEITANAAMGIANAWAQAPAEGLIHGPVLAAILTGIITATSIAQIAAANSQRQKVKAMTLESTGGSGNTVQQRVVLPGAEAGGYTETERLQDGKIFRARRRKQRGYADEPTVLVGESGAEFVANAAAVANPTIKPVLDLINIAQQNGSISSINLPKLINSTYAVKGFESGGYTSTPTAETPALASADNKEIIAIMRDVRSLLNDLKTNGVDAWVVLSQLQKQQELLNKSQELGSRKQ